jgi:hypothetical protein
MKRTHKLALLLAILLTAITPLSSVSANSLPPPSELWFTFDFQNPTPPSVEQFTIVFCSDEDCSYSVELSQIPNSADMSFENELYCYENWCKWRLNPPTHPYSTLGDINLPGFGYDVERLFFKVKIRFSNGEQISNVLDGIPTGIGDEAHYKVTDNQQTLLLTADDNFKSPVVSGRFRSFLLTLLVEPLVFAILAWLWKRENFRSVLNYYLLSLLANGISYPMLWGFFPSITKYHYNSADSIGLISLLGGLAFSILLGASAYVERVTSDRLRALAVLLLTCICYLIFETSIHYGVYPEPISSTGIPVSAAITLVEVLAVAFECVFIYFMSRRKIPLPWALTFCLLANAASFGLGLIVFK